MERLLKIKPESNRILLLWIPPIYSLWLIAIGDKYYENQTTKSIFKIVAGMLFGLFTLPVFAIPYYLFSDFDIFEFSRIMRPISIAGNIFWLITVSMLAKLTVDLDRISEPERHFTITDNIDYIRRFFAFMYWPFFIWTLQRSIQQHEKKSKELPT